MRTADRRNVCIFHAWQRSTLPRVRSPKLLVAQGSEPLVDRAARVSCGAFTGRKHTRAWFGCAAPSAQRAAGASATVRRRSCAGALSGSFTLLAQRRLLASMSWEAGAEELEGLLATRCERVLPTAEAVALVQDEGGFCTAVDRCGALPPPSSQERSRLIRCGCQSRMV